jgi:preprotein translocase subunit SecG
MLSHFVIKYFSDINNRGGMLVLVNILMVVDVIICIGLIIAVMLQTSQSTGFSSSIGGGGESMFGGKGNDVDAFLAKVTIVLGIAFGLVTLIIAKLQ